MKPKLIILPLFFLLSCGENKLNKVETLGGFRVLAIQTANPELTQATGLTVTARPYITDINGGGRTVSGVVDGCVDPGIAAGAEATCDGNSTKVSAAYSVDTSALPNLKTGWGAYSAALSIPDTIFIGRSAREKFNGVPFIILFNLAVDGSSYKAFRRILVTNRTTLNTNPTLTGLQLNGAVIAKPRNGDYLSATYSGAETYDYMLVDGATESRTEKLVMAWYVSEGNFDIAKTNANESVKYNTDPPANQLLMIGVLRDERGGVAVTQSLQ